MSGTTAAVKVATYKKGTHGEANVNVNSSVKPAKNGNAEGSSARSSSPIGSHQLPELDVSGVSVISTLSRQDVTRRTIDGPSRQAQLEKYKADKESKEMEYDILQAKALIAAAELSWAPPPDLRENQTRNKELKQKIEENTKEIQMIMDFCQKVSVLLEAQFAADQAQKRLDAVKKPSQDHVQTLEELFCMLKGKQLVSNVHLAQGDELSRLKTRLAQLFSFEEQMAVENARKYAENMARLSENLANIESASSRLISIEKNEDIWRRHVESLRQSLELANIWQEVFQNNVSKSL